MLKYFETYLVVCVRRQNNHPPTTPLILNNTGCDVCGVNFYTYAYGGNRSWMYNTEKDVALGAALCVRTQFKFNQINYYCKPPVVYVFSKIYYTHFIVRV